jgi:hypothetical protein
MDVWKESGDAGSVVNDVRSVKCVKVVEQRNQHIPDNRRMRVDETASEISFS